jgi:LysM repeat protein
MAALTISAPAVRRPRGTRLTEVPSGSVATSSASLEHARKSHSRTASAASPLRLTRRGRRLARTAVILAALLVALVVSIVGHAASSSAGNGPAVSATSTVVVQPGQTLWSIARGVAPGTDVRESVARIQELNGLNGPGASTVRPGQSLIVPANG